MKRILSMTVALVCLTAIPRAYAADFELKPYLGAGLGMFGLELKATDPASGRSISQKSNVFGGFAKFGADIGDYFGAEVRIGGTGTGKKTYPAGFIPATGEFEARIQTDFFASYLAKVQFPINQHIKIYALGGGSTVKGKITIPAFGIQDTKMKTKPSYGAGIEYAVDDQSHVGVEWMQYWNNVTTGTYTKAKMWGIVATGIFRF